MSKYSIITPQFNSYMLMDKYFDSLENQSNKDFEIIIVDDCSTDGSWEKLQQYVRKSTMQIKLLRTEKNNGPGSARNIGIEASTGEWITFVDNDDWIANDFFDIIDDVILKEEVNCVIFDYNICFEGSVTIAHSMYIHEPGRKSVANCIMSVRNHAVGKVYKREYCKNVRYPELRRCEDVAYVCQAIAACGNAYYLNKPLYFYRQRRTSLSNDLKMDHSDMVKAFAILEKEFMEMYPLELKNKSVPDLLYGALLMLCKSGKDNKYILNYIKGYEKKYPEWWKCEIIKYVGVPKRMFLKFTQWHFVPGIRIMALLHSIMMRKGF